MLRRYSMLFVTVMVLTAGTWGNATAHTTFDATLAQQLQDALQTQQVSLGLTGVSAAVIVPGQGTWLGASGESSPETGDPVTPDMLFWIASISKTFTAALILQLAEEGKLTLEDPLHAWLPSYATIDSAITIRQLLNHTSGLYDYMASPSILPSFLADPARYWTPEEVLAAFVHDPYFAAGTSWKYSNTNYLLLGMIAEKATQLDLPTEMQNRFGTPLQLNNTHFIWSEAIPDNFIHPWYDLDGDRTPDDLLDFYRTAAWSITWAAGGFISTVEDVATWAKHLYEVDVFTQASLDQMLTFESTVFLFTFPNTGYGLGTFRYSLLGRELWGHGGNISGFSSLVLYVPEDGISVAVCINEEVADVLSVAAELLKPLLAPEPGIEKIWTDIGSGPAVQYAETILTTTDHIEEHLPLIVEAAEQAADRLVNGGHLYATGDEYGFAREVYYRAGGMTMFDHAPEDLSEISDQDVVLVGTLNLNPDQQRAQLQAMREAGALVILFGSDQSPLKNEVDFLIGTGLPPGTAPAVTVQDGAEPICPAGPTGNITAMWTFTGELVAACTRRGEMPTMYQADIESGARDRNQRYAAYAFHDDMEIDPVPSGQVGRAFLAEIRRCLQGMLDHQIPAFRKGGWRMAEAIRAGHKAWIMARSQHMPTQFGLPGDPGGLDPSFTTNYLSRLLNTLGPEDGVVYLGWYYPIGMEGIVDWRALRERGVPLMLITGGRETKPLTPNPWEIHVDPYWEWGDACVEIPGYDVKILPPSGVVQTTALWMIIGETAAGPMVGSATMAPEIALTDQPTRLEITVELDTSLEDVTSVRPDLSPLGISSDLSLDNVGGRRYTGSMITTLSETGKHMLPIEVVAETAERDEYAYLGVTLTVYPGGDAIIYGDGSGEDWTVEVTQAGSDPTSTAFVRSGNASHAVLLVPGIFPGTIEYVPDNPDGLNSFGYTHLEFYINGGETSGQDPQVAGKKLSELGIVLESDTWTQVSIPISELPLTRGRLTGIAISGNIKETFYIDDMKLVAGEPPKGEPLAVDESEGVDLPFSYALSQNYPNPFNPETTISYDVAKTGTVRLSVYALTGQLVRTLVDGEHSAGSYSVVWDGTDDAGRDVASGLYLCRMEAGQFSAVRKLVLVK